MPKAFNTCSCRPALAAEKQQKIMRVTAGAAANAPIVVETAIRAYVDEVRSGAFPTASQSSGMDPSELARALTAVDGCQR